jgi:hypothetical protein
LSFTVQFAPIHAMPSATALSIAACCDFSVSGATSASTVSAASSVMRPAAVMFPVTAVGSPLSGLFFTYGQPRTRVSGAGVHAVATPAGGLTSFASGPVASCCASVNCTVDVSVRRGISIPQRCAASTASIAMAVLLVSCFAP